MTTSVDPANVIRIVDRHNSRQGALISVLEDIQTEYNYLPCEALEIVAESTGRSLVDIYGVATFYRSFSLEPRGKHVACVCMGTACHVRGAKQILESFEEN